MPNERLKLFCVKKHGKVLSEHSDKMAAKHRRDERGGISRGFYVGVGVDHHAHAMPRKTHYKTKAARP